MNRTSVEYPAPIRWYDPDTLESRTFADLKPVGVEMNQPVRDWMLCWDAIQSDLQAIVKLRGRSSAPWREIAEETDAFPYAKMVKGAPLGQHIVVEWERLLNHSEGHGGGEAARLWLRAIRDRELPSSGERNSMRKMWIGGRSSRRNVIVGALPQLLSITRLAIERFQPPYDAEPARDTLATLLPPALIDKMAGPSGEPPELTPPQAKAVPRLPGLLESRRAMLVGCPPGVGKTRLAQIAATAACLRPDGELTGRKALVLLPTRTLVEEQRRSWEDWIAAGDDGDPLLEVVAASADHPQHDRALANGRFEIAVCVYESLARQISAPGTRDRLLDDCALVVVDEWQWIRNRERGLWLDTMISMIAQAEPRPALLLLGPRPDDQTIVDVERWLDGCVFLTPPDRLTDLEVRIAEHRRTGQKRRNHSWTYIAALHPASPAAKEGKSTDRIDGTLELTDVYKQVRDALGADLRPLDHAQMVEPLLVCADRLRDDDNARIIVFSETKRMADFHDPVRKVLNLLEVGVKPRGQTLDEEVRNPWDPRPGSARWPGSTEASDERFRELRRRVPDPAERRQAASWLANGVGFHSRGFSRDLQQLVVEEFSGGLLRLVFATDTIAQGVNLPATDVLIARPERFSDRGVREPLEHELVHQRWNRAGRFGHHRREQPAQGWLWNVVGRGGGNRGGLESLWDRYMSDPLEGSRIQVALVDLEGEDQIEQLAALVLQFLGQLEHPLGGMTHDQLRLLAGQAIATTLYSVQVSGQGARSAPNLPGVVDHLYRIGVLEPDADLEDTLIERLTEEAAVVEDRGRYRVSKLGYGLMGSGTKLADSRTIQNAAEVANRLLGDVGDSTDVALRAGLLDLLWEVLDAPSLRGSVFEALGRGPAWNDLEVGPWHRDVRAQCLAYTLPDIQSRPGELEALGVKHLPSPRVLDAPLPNGEFRVGVEALPVEKLARQLTRTDLTQLARAQATVCVYEWSRYEPFHRIRSRLAACLGNAATMAAVDPIALQELARHAGYLLRAAAPLSADSHEVERVASEVQNGLPRAIMNVMHLSGLGLGREQVAQNLSGAGLTATVDRIASQVGWSEDDWDRYRQALHGAWNVRRSLSGSDLSHRLEWNGDGDVRRADEVLENLVEAEDAETLADNVEALVGPRFLNLDAAIERRGGTVTLVYDDDRSIQIDCHVTCPPLEGHEPLARDHIIVTTGRLPDEQLLAPDPAVTTAAEVVAACRRVLSSSSTKPGVERFVGPLLGDAHRAAIASAPDP